jgi:hypothetical protein
MPGDTELGVRSLDDQFHRFLRKLLGVSSPWDTFHTVTPPSLYFTPTLVYVFSILLHNFTSIDNLFFELLTIRAMPHFDYRYTNWR